MRFGPLFARKSTNSGYGSHCVEKRARSSRSLWVIVVKPPVESFGTLFHRSIGVVRAIPISGRRIKPLFPAKTINLSAKKQERPHISSVLTIRCVNGWHVSYGRLFPFQNHR